MIGLDYDEATVAHVRASYPRVDMRHGNLAELPLPDGAVDVVVNFQVIEHLWDQPQFVAECLRVLRPSGLLLMSTPNRVTFSPGRDTPINPFHTRELNAGRADRVVGVGGLQARVDAGRVPRPHGWPSWTPSTAARSSTRRSPARWPMRRGPHDLLADVASVSIDDFDLTDAGDRDIDDSLDLVAIAVRP